ncbi:MAG TPA: 2Fe-2S iron-sulfur cluster-binding protein [Acidimicrobiales bacterium]|nr:2Fe-2S iron-sulfur cluster-binding protein [Acidimicrobiales bacterium]
MSVSFTLDGRPVEVAREGVTLLEALREDLGVRSVKDGCSPQGQCGCCTVLVDGAARVACVTPVRRVAGRDVRTVDGIDEQARDRLVRAFVASGASQCGFCTPGIVCRLAALGPDPQPAKVETALLAHLCRCTGWRSIVDAATTAPYAAPTPGSARRAGIEGGVTQSTGPDVVLGRGGFADDTAPAGCLVAVPVAGADPAGPDGWSVADTLAGARAAACKIQGRRSGEELTHPVDVPEGDWALTLQTTWVEPAYLEPDASWCEPGGEPASPVANGGAFGAKSASVAPAAARMLADRLGRPVRVVLSREDVVRLGPKRPPMAAGVDADGRGVLRLAGAGPALLEAARAAAGPGVTVESVPVTGPAVSESIRAAGWAEGAVLAAVTAARAAGADEVTVRTPEGAEATARVDVDDTGWPAAVSVTVAAGDPLDEVTLRSYVQGAAHMALGWVCSEGIAVGPDGIPDDLTIRSFGVLRAKDTPPITVVIVAGGGEPVRVSDAAFAAVAAATWLAQGLPSRWPTRRGARR